MLNEEILFKENSSIMLDLINKDLYWVAADKSLILFHDNNCHKLFFIYLHDYLKNEFYHPQNGKKTSLFKLTLTFCEKYKKNKHFKKIITKGNALEKFLIKERKYKNVYFSPNHINIKTNIYELIKFAGIESKHHYFRLSQLKDRLEKIFLENKIPKFSDEEYYEKLRDFMENVVDDKLNYHQTKIVELIGNYFLSINQMLSSKDCQRIRSARNHAIKNTPLGQALKIEKPLNMSDIEEFYWKIMWVGGVKEERLCNLIPKTSPYLQKRD